MSSERYLAGLTITSFIAVLNLILILILVVWQCKVRNDNEESPSSTMDSEENITAKPLRPMTIHRIDETPYNMSPRQEVYVLPVDMSPVAERRQSQGIIPADSYTYTKWPSHIYFSPGQNDSGRIQSVDNRGFIAERDC
ncbi:hypothetical protein Ahia01_000796600 [Argonauta hians]